MISKISVVIPHVRDVGADEHLENLCDQLDSQVDEVFIVNNDGIGYGPAVNVGLFAVEGDYLIVSNNDIRILYGDLKDLCVPDTITVPDIVPRPKDYWPRCFFCMDRSVYENLREDEYYFYDEQFFPGYFEDDDLIERILRSDISTIKVSSVRIEHFNGGGLTMKQFGEQESYDANRQRYEEKWNIIPR